MISYLLQGRYGNALFQAAATIALALRNDVEFSMPTFTSSNFWSPLILPHLVNPNYIEGRSDVIITETQYHYAPLPYYKEWNNYQVQLQGYFQSEYHFIDFKNEVIELFNFPYKFNEGFVSVHIRRTDFIELSHKHPSISDEWYFEAMGMFPNKKFIVFSDDIPYCKSAFEHRNDCYFSEGKTPEQDIIEMANCEHSISSASTFSWWASYLNKNPDKKVIIPNKWFCTGWDNADTKDVIPENWIKL